MSGFDLNRFKTKARDDVGRIEVETLEPTTPPRVKRKSFKVSFTQVPEFWANKLETLKSWTTWQLARRILRAVHIQQNTYWPEPVTLSRKMTGLAKTSRNRATDNMVNLGLIRTKQDGHGAAVVVELLLGDGESIRLKHED
jgi:hypothetical protein